jgi:hypothetical protein
MLVTLAYITKSLKETLPGIQSGLWVAQVSSSHYGSIRKLVQSIPQHIMAVFGTWCNPFLITLWQYLQLGAIQNFSCVFSK